MVVGEVGVRCPECDDILLVSVELFIVTEDDEPANTFWGSRWATKIDDADLWAHAWAHDAEFADG